MAARKADDRAHRIFPSTITYPRTLSSPCALGLMPPLVSQICGLLLALFGRIRRRFSNTAVLRWYFRHAWAELLASKPCLLYTLALGLRVSLSLSAFRQRSGQACFFSCVDLHILLA